MLPPPYPATFRLARLGDAAPATAPASSVSHWEPAIILFGGGLTITGLILQAKGHKELGTLAYVSAILSATVLAALRCYR